MSAGKLVARLRARELSASEVAQAFLDAVEGDPLRAWETIDAPLLLAAAARLDRVDQAERARLPLFGLPVGIKDNFDTADLPTGYGSPIYSGYRPAADAGLVARLRAAGALIAGKTKCAEFAWMTAPDTRNPLDPARTPGGSSSGSAAAVGAGVVPVATGTQTAGSINRPASYCGAVGYKPTFGRLPRDGVKLLSPALDTVGLLAGEVDDLGFVLDALCIEAAGAALTGAPRLALARTPAWGRVAAEAALAIEEVATAAAAAGAAVVEEEPPVGFEALIEAQTTIQFYDSARSLARELEHDADRLSDELRAALRDGAAMPPGRREQAGRVLEEHGAALVGWLAGYDGILTPSADGVPPGGLEFTGDPLFCRVWTLVGAPCVSVPLAWTEGGLPAGLQLVGAPGCDQRVLRAAQWLSDRLPDRRVRARIW